MTYKDAIKTLQKRADWLSKRIENSDKDLSHDKRELDALNVAIDLMADFMGCDGVPA